MPVEKTIDRTAEIIAAIDTFTRGRVLVGIPSDKAERPPDNSSDRQVTNAQIGYWMEKGTVTAPARPHLVPGIQDAQPDITRLFKQVAKNGIKGDLQKVEYGLVAAGEVAVNAVKARIIAGVPPPLALSTLRARVRNRTAVQGAKAEIARRKAGLAPSTEYALPLNATGEYRNSITYVVDEK